MRFAIRALEAIFANTKHRAWRKGMAHAKTYDEWYEIAKRLDGSQGREKWRSNVEDDTAYRYSWPFILEMLKDLKSHRENKDLTMAMAVLQQCTRKNVGGIMSDDLFSFTNCGEPKQVVSEFIDEVVQTLNWVTEEVREMSRAVPPDVTPEAAEARTERQKESLETGTNLNSKEAINTNHKSKEEEENPLLNQVVAWATLGILGSSREENKGKSIEENKGKTKEENKGKAETEKKVNHMPMDLAAPYLCQGTNVQEEYAINLRRKIKTFLKRAKWAYGRTALCLSGGVS